MFIFIQVHSAVFSSRNLRLCEKVHLLILLLARLKTFCFLFCSSVFSPFWKSAHHDVTQGIATSQMAETAALAILRPSDNTFF